MKKYDEIYGNIGAVELDESNEGARERDVLWKNQMLQAVEKAELFDECLEHLEKLKYTANPNDVIGVYENVISVFREYLSKEDSK